MSKHCIVTLMYPDRHLAYTSKMYKTVKSLTNLPVKICHLKVWRCGLPHTKTQRGHTPSAQIENRFKSSRKHVRRRLKRIKLTINKKSSNKGLKRSFNNNKKCMHHTSTIYVWKLVRPQIKSPFTFKTSNTSNAQGWMYIKICVTFWS